jgi:hypothetical protein
MKDDRTIYMNCKCGYDGSMVGFQGEDGIQVEDDRTIYMQCSCSYDGSGSKIQGEDDRTIYADEDKDGLSAMHSRRAAEKAA